jgi:hypothetical protein
MWTLHLLLHTWLSGSFLLPIMLLLLWGGSKWRRLDWLTRSRKRWLLVWGCYGFVKVITFTAIFWAKYSLEYGGAFDYLGWASAAAWSSLRILHIRNATFPVAFLLGFALKAIVEPAIDSGLAAIVWRVYGSLSHETRPHRRIATIERYGVSLLFSACALGIANNFHFARMGTCSDCFRPDGIPFTLFHEGGFAGGEGFVWKGVIADSVIVLVVGIALGLIWNKLAVKDSNLRYS